MPSPRTCNSLAHHFLASGPLRFLVLLLAFVVVVPPAQALPPQKSVDAPISVFVRPGGTSYSFNIVNGAGAGGAMSAIQDIGFQNITAFSWFLTRGGLQSSTDGGANWTPYTVLTDNITTYLTVSGRIWRFVDTSPGDSTSTNSFSNCWHLVSAPASTTCSGGTIIPDNAPTNISSSKDTLFDNTSVGATIATLTPTDSGDTLRGFWTLESQSVPNLFALSFNRTTGNTATLTRGSAAVPAIGQTPTVTVRYHDVYQTDAIGNPIAGQGFSKTLTYTVVAETSNALTLGSDIAVNTFTTGNQSGQSVALLSSGNVAVVWQSAAQGGGDGSGVSGIYGQLLSSAGAKVGGEFVISNVSSNIDEVTPVVTALASGRYVVAYATSAGVSYDIRFRFVEANGTVGSEFSANTTTAGAQTYPAIVTTNDGNFVLAWNSDNGDIRARKFNTAGAAVTPEVLFADGNVAGGYYPFVAALSNGDYALAWADYAASHVFVRLAPGGTPGTVIDTGIITGGYTPPRLVGLSNASFVVASESYNAGSTRYQIEAIRYSNAGAVQTAKFQVNSVSSGNRYAASVAALTGGGFIVGWGADNGDFDLSGVFGRRYSATAVAVDASEFQINQHRLDDQNYPALAPLAGDLFLATWTDVTGASVAANTYFGDIEARVLGPVAVPDLTVTKTANGGFQQGGSASYTVTVTNSGTGPTTAAYTVTDTMPTGLTVTTVATSAAWNCTASTSTVVSCTSSSVLAASASATSITITVAIAANAPASITNTASVSGGGEAVTGNNSGVSTVSVTQIAPDLTVSKTAVGVFQQGGSASYTVAVTNSGNGPTTASYTLTDTMPTGLTAGVVTSPDAGWNCTASTGTIVSCTRSTALAAATATTLTIPVTIAANAPASITNTASVSGGGETVTGNNSGVSTVSVTQIAPDLTVVKVAQGGPFQQGGTVSYQITVNNIGNGPTSGTISMLDTIPTGLTVTSVSGTNWICTNAATVSCTRTLPLAASANSVITLAADISLTAPASITNTATVQVAGESNTGNNSGTSVISVAPTQADLSITKTDGVTSVTSGTSTTYTITASNAGPSNVPSATVADTFPAACVSPTWTCMGAGGGVCTGGGSGNINDTVVLPAGASVSYTAVCPISASATGTLSNTATIGSPITDPAGGNNSATDSDSIVRPVTSVVSLNRAVGNPNNSPDVIWTITFSHPVGGLSASNFAPVNGGLGGAILVQPPTELSGPPSAVWNISVLTGTGSGTLGLNLVNDAGMTHSVGNSPFVGQVFTIDRTAPSATIAVSDSNLVAGESSPVTIVFNEVVTGFDASDLAVENGSILPLRTSDNITYTTSLTPTAAIVDPTNVITLAAGGVLDLASNPNTASVSNNYEIDTRIRQISVDDVSISEGNTGTSTLNFMVSLSLPAANGGVSFNIATQDGTAVAPSDYVARTQNGATIAEGASSFAFAVQVNGDALVEANETLLVNLSSVVGATVLDGQGRGTITNDDSAGVTITQTGTTDVTEGGATDTYSAVLTSQPTADVTITPSTTGEVSLSPASRTFTAANWNVAQSFTVTATDDAIVEGAESATITHSSASGDPNYQGATVASVSAAISDNDSATVQFAPTTLSQTEGTSPMAFTVTLSAPVQSGVTLTVNSAPGTATAADFTAISGGTVTFAANTTTSQTVNVVINNDVLDENDESYTLTLSGLTATGNVTLGAATATGTILDDDPTPTLSVTSPSLAEGNAGTSTMNFVVSLNAVSGRDVTFTRATADGTATVANIDYVALSAATLTIPAGQTSLTIPVTINGDTPYEGNESFSLVITGVSNATPASISGTGTIIDDDQQPTTTTITGDTPDPTVVGQPYTVSVTVAAQTTSPLGTVTISDGSASCTATLTAGTPPSSAMSCLLTSTSAGAKTLTASYTPASSAFAASSDTDTHQVNAAATTISVSGPARSRINQATSFSFVLGVTTPGAGTPTGVVTLSSGAASCTATLPATSCNLTFNTLGARTVTASYASDGNFSSSTSSGAGNAQTLVYALSDLSISKTDGIGYYEPGDLLVYSVIVRNLGPDDAANIRVVDTIPAGLTDVVWSCDASGGGVCPAAGGAGNLDVVLANVRVGALLNFTFFGNVAGSPLVIANTAAIVLPVDTTIDDPVPGNNSATDTDQIDFTFRDGFENPPVSAPSGSARIPAIALARELGDEARVVLSLKDAQGEALRVYARLHDERLQYALARRANNGTLRLEAWRSLPGEPTLSWSARAVATGWVMEAAELR